MELDLPQGSTIIQGDNAQGKTNLLEAIYFLATARSHRTAVERELVNWSATEEASILSRLSAVVQKARDVVKIDIALHGINPEVETSGVQSSGVVAAGETDVSPPAINLRKRIQVNGIPRRVSELVGQVNVVLFSSQDIELIAGAPTLRRRYLDMTISQVEPRYFRALQRYNKVLLQRNHLLRLIGEGSASIEQLEYWDKQLVETGSYIIRQRYVTVRELNRFIELIHPHLTGQGEQLKIIYASRLGRTGGSEIEDINALNQRFQEKLNSLQRREIYQGVTLTGPHRDDLQFVVNAKDMGIYGSRGQQRTIALSLRLAEARFMSSFTGEQPVLLLDDVLSELDESRRRYLTQSILGHQQVILTTTDLDRFQTDFLSQSTLLTVKKGEIKPEEDSDGMQPQ